MTGIEPYGVGLIDDPFLTDEEAEPTQLERGRGGLGSGLCTLSAPPVASL